MWRGKINDELKSVFRKYEDIFGDTPDSYDDVDVNEWSLSEFIKIIKWCIDNNKDLETLSNEQAEALELEWEYE